MRMSRSLAVCALIARAWQLTVPTLLALGCGVAFRPGWGHDATLPTFVLPVPAPLLFPPLLSLLVLPMLTDPWRHAPGASPRSRPLLRLARLCYATAVTVVAGLAFTWHEPSHEALSVALLFMCLGAVLSAWIGGHAWAPLLVAAYLWLLVAVRRDPVDVTPHDGTIALLTALAVAVLYCAAGAPRRR